MPFDFLKYPLSLPTNDEFLFLVYILMRVMGLIIVAPILSNKAINPLTRIFIGIYIALLLGMVLYPQYLGPFSQYKHSELWLLSPKSLPMFVLVCTKEIAVGYIIGYCFEVALQGMNLAGQMIDSMIGFSTAQFIDPISSSFHSLLGFLLVLFGALVMLLVDFHHVFIRCITESFNVIPLGEGTLTQALFDDITTGTSWIFVYAIKYGAVPITILAGGLVGIAFTVRVVPEMNLLLTGLPMRVLLGLMTMIWATGRLVPVFKNSFISLYQLSQRIIEHLAV